MWQTMNNALVIKGQSLANISAETVKSGVQYNVSEYIETPLNQIVGGDADLSLAAVVVEDANSSYQLKAQVKNTNFENSDATALLGGFRSKVPAKKGTFTRFNTAKGFWLIGQIDLVANDALKNGYIVMFFNNMRIIGDMKKLMLFSLLILVPSILILGLLGFLISRSIVKPISLATAGFFNLAKGDSDLTKRIDLQLQDEIGEMAGNINLFIDRIHNDMVIVSVTSDELMNGAGRSRDLVENVVAHKIEAIKDSVTKINRQVESSSIGMEEQSSTLEEMARNISSILASMHKQATAVEEGASSIEQMVHNIESTANMARKSHEISNSLNQIAIEGGETVKTSVQATREVSEYSQQILKLLNLITNIAEQTNLLSMNAAIEAAHAGESGRGFAIVAAEIRRLSVDTNKNAKDIGDVVGTILKKIDQSAAFAERAQSGLATIVDFSRQNSEIITQLNTAMSEQNSGAKEILFSTQEMVKITEEVKIAMGEQKQATDEFNVTLHDLKNTVLQSKENVKSHLENMNALISAQNEVREIIHANAVLADKLHALVGNFKLGVQHNNKFSNMKLVE
jgi:methyl-accepting chemotaxis protein